MEEDQLRERCRQIAQQVLAKNGWGLVRDADAFIEEVLVEVRRRQERSRLPRDKIIEHATLNRYCHLWHAACKDDNVLRQRQALRDLHRYLYRVALYRAGGDEFIAQEGAQEALVNIWRALDTVVDPGSFLSFAKITVSREVAAQFDKRSETSGGTAQETREIQEADLTFRGGSEEAASGTRGVDSQPDSASRQEPQMTDEMRDRLEAAIRQCLENEDQQAAIIGLFFDELSGKEMAEALHTTPGYVYVLKHRAVEYLRKCKELVEVLEEMVWGQS